MNLPLQRWISFAASVALHGGGVCQGPAWGLHVGLTFDDGPHPRWTPLVLDELARAGLVATFFVVGRSVAKFPHIVKEARRQGHEIGTHLYWHRRTAHLNRDQLLDEIARSRDELEQLLGERIRFMRFPYGERAHLSAQFIRREFGLESVHWTFSSLDSRATNTGELVRRVSPRLRPGAIILMHDCLADADENLPERYNPDREALLAFLPALHELLLRKGLKSATLSQLIDPPWKTEDPNTRVPMRFGP